MSYDYYMCDVSIHRTWTHAELDELAHVPAFPGGISTLTLRMNMLLLPDQTASRFYISIAVPTTSTMSFEGGRPASS